MSNYSVYQDLCPIYEDDEQYLNRHELVSSTGFTNFRNWARRGAAAALITPTMALTTNRQQDTLSEDIDWSMNDIYLPDDMVKLQADNWSMKSYPIEHPKDNYQQLELERSQSELPSEDTPTSGMLLGWLYGFDLYFRYARDQRNRISQQKQRDWDFQGEWPTNASTSKT